MYVYDVNIVCDLLLMQIFITMTSTQDEEIFGLFRSNGWFLKLLKYIILQDSKFLEFPDIISFGLKYKLELK